MNKSSRLGNTPWLKYRWLAGRGYTWISVGAERLWACDSEVRAHVDIPEEVKRARGVAYRRPGKHRVKSEVVNLELFNFDGCRTQPFWALRRWLMRMHTLAESTVIYVGVEYE